MKLTSKIIQTLQYGNFRCCYWCEMHNVCESKGLLCYTAIRAALDGRDWEPKYPNLKALADTVLNRSKTGHPVGQRAGQREKDCPKDNNNSLLKVED